MPNRQSRLGRELLAILERHFCPEIEPPERKRAEIEGSILGVL